MKKDNDFK
jgi:transposase, IS6 family